LLHGGRLAGARAGVEPLGNSFLRVISISGGQADREWDAMPFTDQMLPRSARSVGFGPVCVPPHTALTEQLSTMARDQSLLPSRASQLS
jgi:hypothetical protein